MSIDVAWFPDYGHFVASIFSFPKILNFRIFILARKKLNQNAGFAILADIPYI